MSSWVRIWVRVGVRLRKKMKIHLLQTYGSSFGHGFRIRVPRVHLSLLGFWVMGYGFKVGV